MIPFFHIHTYLKKIQAHIYSRENFIPFSNLAQIIWCKNI